MTCIAHGKDEQDPEITEAVVRRQLEALGEKVEEFLEESEIDLDSWEGPEGEAIRQHVQFAENHPLPATAEAYRKRTHAFLEEAVYPKRASLDPALCYDCETVNWYHTLLPVKLKVALAGFHEPAAEGDLSLYHAVGQLEVCKKAAQESEGAFRRIRARLPTDHRRIGELLVLLRNMDERIRLMEESAMPG